MGVIAKMAGIAIHDGWKPYRSYDVVHALCNAHHLREFEGIGVVWDQGSANELADLLIEARDAVEDAKAEGKDRLGSPVLHSIRVRYGTLVKRGWAQNPAPEVAKRSGDNKKAANLLVRLDTQRQDVLRFATNFDVSFTNNQGERDIRMVKLQQKISGSWRSLDGARNYCAVRSYISTMKKHGVDMLGGLRQLFDGQVWLPGALPETPGDGRRPVCDDGQLMARQRREPDLGDLIGEITTDCYNDDEELMGFENAFDEEAGLPCLGTVIGEKIQVLSIATQSGRRELIATCERHGRRSQVALLDIELQTDAQTQRLFAAYRQWAAFH